MTVSSDDPQNTADLRGPGDPEEAKDQAAKAPRSALHPDQPGAANIREEQQAQAAGTVPASYMGGDEADPGHKPEEALEEPGTWDDEV